jgi:hypothetical protein
MRGTESPRCQHESFFVMMLAFTSPSAPWHEPELHGADHGMGDYAEGPLSSWEAAWIDLGGEG